MDWKRVKNILIFLLLATNLILAVSIYSQFSARSSAERQAIRSALELVGDTLDLHESVILGLPREIYSLRVTREPAQEDAFAQNLLGGAFTSEPGGGGISRYAGENGRGEIKRGGEIEFFLSPVAEQTEQYYSKLLKEAGLIIARTEPGADGWSFFQSYAGYPILGYSLTCSDYVVTGHWLISDTWVREQSVPSRAELVIRLAAAAGELGLQTIDAIHCGYTIENTGVQDSIAFPVWLVESGGVTLVFDLIRGSIIG